MTRPTPPPPGSSGDVEHFLDDLREAMTDRAGADDAIDEVTGHLLDLRDDLIAAGHDPRRAEHLAVERFGSVETVAAGHRSSLLPVAHEIGWLAAATMCALGLAGLGAVVVRAVTDTGAPADAAVDVFAALDLVHVLVGMVGAAAAELLWLRRGDRTIRPGSRVRKFGTAGLVSVGCTAIVLAGLALTPLALHRPERWLVLGVSILGAAIAYAMLSRRLTGTA